MAATPNLIQRHQTWYVVVAVPRRLWRPGVKRQVVRTLGTRDKAEALRKRFATIADILANIEHLSGAKPANPAGLISGNEIPAKEMASALALRRTLSDIDAGDVTGLTDGRPANVDPRQWARFIVGGIIEENADDLADTHGEVAAQSYAGIAKGTATPLLLHVDAWARRGRQERPALGKDRSGLQGRFARAGKVAGRPGRDHAGAGYKGRGGPVGVRNHDRGRSAMGHC